MEQEISNVNVDDGEIDERGKRRELQRIFYALTYQVHAFERILIAKNIANPRSRGNANALTLFMRMIQMIVLHQIPVRRVGGNSRSNYGRPSRRTVEDLEKIVEEVRNLVEMFEPAKNDRRNPTLSLFIQIITFILQEKQGGRVVGGGLNPPSTKTAKPNLAPVRIQIEAETQTLTEENLDKSSIEEMGIRLTSASPLTPSPTPEKLIFSESSNASTPEVPKEAPKLEPELERETETETEAETETVDIPERKDTPIPDSEKLPQRPTHRVKIEPRASTSSTDEGSVYGEELIPKKKYDRKELLQIREWVPMFWDDAHFWPTW